MTSIEVDHFLPQPPGRMWQALTDPALLARWLMRSDFKPVVGLRWGRRVATAQGAAPGTEAGNQAGPVATGRAGSVTQSDQEPT